MIVREIQPEDNKQIATVIRSVFDELGICKVGTAYEDPSLDTMFQAYDRDRAVYYVVAEEGVIYGGGGIAQLDNYQGNVCELQKMYFTSEARGKGLGYQMMELCLSEAKSFGFESCYLETMPYMEAAQKLYKKFGFEYIEQPLGNTGHYSCPIWMLKTL